MTWDVFLSVWPVLAGLAYLLFTFVLLVLAAQRSRTLTVHDRIRDSKVLRKRYLKALADKMKST